jgi:hypothetical protein
MLKIEMLKKEAWIDAQSSKDPLNTSLLFVSCFHLK